jgi:hypothetical protein
MQWKDIAESVASAELSATEYWVSGGDRPVVHKLRFAKRTEDKEHDEGDGGSGCQGLVRRDAKMVPGFCGGRTACGWQVEAQYQHTDACLTVEQDQRLVGGGRARDCGGGMDEEDRGLEAVS